ncbi:C40 family peptidase [Desulforamulus hydrothermalis]|uniref:NLP/P60 protein n=1 Tax=Desulforamulus hydrothermalis Lam5 = DSM 18033 TaxID=1121428 RepID=K8E0V1_9FIRM|nr:C40 family peptidase [Desulforamulus hydrothermalis]CCO09274.1 NLP/P60 protein [Desulforamulus hydrothermalis Lam5 = DSM 18033]SHH05165.1 NlpC/P60 family protein [Desulforamulus hydrothermalis Lam5 = DSM 18033]
MFDLRQAAAGTVVVAAAAVVDVLEQPEAGIPLVTQLLMGWPAQVLGLEGDWFHIQAQDGSPGWARVENFCLPCWPTNTMTVQITRAAAPLFAASRSSAGSCGTLFLGSRLPLLDEDKDFLRVALPQGDSALVRRQDAAVFYADQPVDQQQIVSTAGLYLGASYLWGGMTVQGIDCSGLTYMAYYANGIQLPRDAQDQYKAGVPVTDLIMGDLVFFSTIVPGPSHVGLYLENGLFLNARTKEGVTVSSLSDGFFASRYLGARRYL